MLILFILGIYLDTLERTIYTLNDANRVNSQALLGAKRFNSWTSVISSSPLFSFFVDDR